MLLLFVLHLVLFWSSLKRTWVKPPINMPLRFFRRWSAWEGIFVCVSFCLTAMLEDSIGNLTTLHARALLAHFTTLPYIPYLYFKTHSTGGCSNRLRTGSFAAEVRFFKFFPFTEQVSGCSYLLTSRGSSKVPSAMERRGVRRCHEAPVSLWNEEMLVWHYRALVKGCFLVGFIYPKTTKQHFWILLGGPNVQSFLRQGVDDVSHDFWHPAYIPRSKHAW